MLSLSTLGVLPSQAHAWFSVGGFGSGGAFISSMTSPASPNASVSNTAITLSWGASSVSGETAASSYTVERYSAAGTDLGQACGGAISSSQGVPDAQGSFSCTDAPEPGSYKYVVTSHYGTWTAHSALTNSVTFALTDVTLTSSANPAAIDEPTTFTATVAGEPSGAPTGKVEFLDGSAAIGGCAEQTLTSSAPYQATCRTTYSTTGEHSISARYLGDTVYPSAASATLTESISAAAGTLTPLSPATVTAGEGTARVTVSPDGESVYATNRGTTTVSQYSRNKQTGGLSPLSPATVQSGSAPEGIIVSPDGNDVYVANGHSNSVSQYTRDQITGALTPMSPSTVSAGEDPIGIAASPDGQDVYVADADSKSVFQYARNATTGQLTELAAPVAAGANAHGIVISPDGKNAYVTNYDAGTISQYARNTTTGVLTPLGKATVSGGTNPHDVAISPDGKSVYVADNTSPGQVRQLSRSAETGALTSMSEPTVSAGEYTECVAVSPDGKSVYATSFSSADVTQYARNELSGSLTALAPSPTVTTGSEPEGIAVSPTALESESQSVYVADSGAGSLSLYSRWP